MGDVPAKPLSVQDRVAEKVKNTFLDLIAEDEWNEMVKRQLDHFVKDSVQGTGFHARTTTSPLNYRIREELRKLILDRIVEVVSSQDWLGVHGPDDMLEPGNLAKEISNQFSATGLQAMQAQIIQTCLWNFQQKVQSMINNGDGYR